MLSRAEALRVDDASARAAAVERCARDPVFGSAKVFCTAGHDPDDRVRLAWDRSIEVLADREGVEWLLRDGLQHPDRAVRYAAWRRWLTPPVPSDAVVRALSMLEDNYEEIQFLALDRLGETRDPAILNAARFFVRSRYSPRVRLRAAVLLAIPGEAGFVNAGISAVVEQATPPPADSSPGDTPVFPPPDFAFERAIERLGEGLDDPAAFGLLTEMAASGTRPAPTPALAARAGKQVEMAIRVLHRSRSPEGGLALLTLARDGVSRSIRREAIAALSGIDHPIRDERLIDLLRSEPDPDLRLAVAWAIRAMNPRSKFVASAMAEAAKRESDWRVRAALEGAAGAAPEGAARRAAIERALDWLCRTQEAGGDWRAGAASDAAVTARALLALLGSTADGGTKSQPREKAIRNAGRWLSGWIGARKRRTDAGGFFRSDPAATEEALVRWALSELLDRHWRTLSDSTRPESERLDSWEELSALIRVVHRALPEPQEFSARTVDWEQPGAGDTERAAAEVASLLALCGGEGHFAPPANGGAVRAPPPSVQGAGGFGAGGTGAPSGPEGFAVVVDALRRQLREAASLLLARCSSRRVNGAIPSEPFGTFWYSGLGSSARAVVLSHWLGVPLGTGGNAEAEKWLGATSSKDVATLAHLSFHRPVWEPYFEIVGPQPSVPDPLWPLPRTEDLASNGAVLFSSWEDDIVDLDYWFWGAMAADLHRGEPWAKEWRASLERVLLAEQRQAGAEAGSWDPEGPWERVSGRVGATALGAMALEVPDRRWGVQQ
ncbi:MAG: HEAT repeat domain-containing protein [Planctomycetes bacterium]|nr:HEAT repeat domain-containing protein [Planctomycetota bacterium]